MHRLLLVAFALLFSFLPTTPSFAEPGHALSREEATRQSELLFAERMAKATNTTLLAPYYSTATLDSSTLYLLNTGMLPVAIQVRALPHAGGSLKVGEYLLEPRSHLRIALAEDRRLTAPPNTSGAIEIQYLGDTDLVQGWLVLARDAQVVELPLQHLKPEARRRPTYSMFWTENSGTAQLWAFNPKNHPIEMVLTLNSGQLTPTTIKVELQPRESRDLLAGHLLPSSGSLRLRSFDSTIPLLAGLAQTESTLLRLPIVTSTDSSKERLALRWPPAIRSYLSLFSQQRAVVEVLARDRKGDQVGKAQLEVPADKPREVVLEDLLPQARSQGAERLEIRSSAALQVSGFAVEESGTLVEMQFFAPSDAHGGGTYPLPDLITNEVVTTLVNVGSNPQRIVGQVFWDGGEYALDGIVIAPGATFKVDFGQLAQSATPDILGRILPASLSEGYFKWTAIGGGPHELFGRTEVFPRATGDAFGFNCWGCCWELPYGQIVPGRVELVPGQPKFFEACFMLNTCGGVLGPYFANITSLSVPSPFSWNGYNVTVSGGASDTLSFQGVEEEKTANCVLRDRTTGDNEEASSCRAEHLGPLDPGRKCWEQTPTCGTCCACVWSKWLYWQCEGKLPGAHNPDYQRDKLNCEDNLCGGYLCPLPQSLPGVRSSK